MPVGTIGSSPGPMLAGSGRFSVTIHGKGWACCILPTAAPSVDDSLTILSDCKGNQGKALVLSDQRDTWESQIRSAIAH
ncbi:unnamed protein product [Prunus armeniaca]